MAAGPGEEGGWAVPRRVKLAAVKSGLYNPRLPSLRRMDTDDMMRKLPTEHNRHSTYSTAEEYRNSSLTLFDDAKKTYPALGFAHTGGSLTVNDIFSPDGKRSLYRKKEFEKPWSRYMPLLTEAARDWSTFVSRCGEFQIPCEASRGLHYSGYAVRYLKPNVTQSWKYTFQSDPTLIQYDQMPIPVSTLNKHRSFTTALSRTALQRPWY